MGALAALEGMPKSTACVILSGYEVQLLGRPELLLSELVLTAPLQQNPDELHLDVCIRFFMRIARMALLFQPSCGHGPYSRSIIFLRSRFFFLLSPPSLNLGPARSSRTPQLVKVCSSPAAWQTEQTGTGVAADARSSSLECAAYRRS